MSRRSILKTQANVLFAIFFREIHRKFGDFKLGILWTLLEPMLMLSLFILIFGLKGSGAFGFVEPPLFILAAFLPFKTIFNDALKTCSKASNVKRGLATIPQVTLFDIIIGKMLISYLVGITVGLIIAILLWWLFDLDPVPDSTIEVLFTIFSMCAFGAAIGMGICMVQDIAKEIGKMFDMITFPLLILSAVIYPMTAVPEPYQSMLAWNPLVHPMEMIREYWFPKYSSPVADMVYWYSWVIGAIFFGLMLYRLRWKRVMAL